MRRWLGGILLGVLILAALAAAAYLVWRLGWVWTLVVAPAAVLLIGLLIQGAGILSREEQ